MQEMNKKDGNEKWIMKVKDAFRIIFKREKDELTWIMNISKGIMQERDRNDGNTS
jgi:hypothetical protein